MDQLDKKILYFIQKDSTFSISDIAKKIGISTTPCWHRIRNLEEKGIIAKRVALLNPEKINVNVMAFVSIQTKDHTIEWYKEFSKIITTFPEVLEFYRMSGEIDYLLRVVIPDLKAYDIFYKKLISKIQFRHISTNFCLQQIKYTTELPLDYISIER